MSTDTSVESVAQYPDEWSDEEFGRRLRAFKAEMIDIARMARGAWQVPSQWRQKLEDFHFIRLGTMTNVAHHTRILLKKALLEQQGWKEAPKGVRNAMFPHDQEHGVYLCMPKARYREWQDLHRELVEMSRKANAETRRKDMVDQLERGDGPRLVVEKLEVERVQTTVADLLGETGQARRRK